MKKYRIISAFLIVCMFFTQAVSAATLTMTGTADRDALGVTVLVMKKGEKVADANEYNVVYVDQTDIDADGNFSITLPLLDTEDYDFHSNMEYDLFEDSGDMLDVIYVSSNGSDYGNGSSEHPFATLSKAYTRVKESGKIIIKDSATYTASSKKVIISGETSSATLVLGSEIELQGELTLSNITLPDATTIYACGHAFKVESTVSTTNRLSVYGGSKLKDVSGDTNITLLGGKYNFVFGGGYKGKVSGNTNVVLGGNANSGDGVDGSNTETLSPCMAFGGGNNGAVNGDANITLKDNAVTKYLVGAGYNENGTAGETNVFIEGGKAMNVYAASRNTVLPAGASSHVTITGGSAESIFGGCESVAMTGHTFVNLLGGQVTRRVYSGCYNGVDIGISGAIWSDTRHVTGTTNIVIGPDVLLNTKNGLSSEDSVNVGVFAGSRMETQLDEEQNTIIYLDGCYSTHSKYIGEKSSNLGFISLSTYLKSFEDYVIKSTDKGTVKATTTAGTIYVAPDRGYVASVAGNEYDNENVTVSSGTTDVSFIEKDFFINSVTTGEITETGINGSADIFANNRASEEEPRIFVALYDENLLLKIYSQPVTESDDNLSFDIKCKLEKGKTYTVKAMIWDKNIKPLTTSYEIKVK